MGWLATIFPFATSVAHARLNSCPVQRVSLQQPHVAHPKFSFVDPSSLPQRICPLLSINTTVKMKVQSNSALARLLNILRFKADFGLGVVAHLVLNLHISRSSHLHIPIFYPHLNAAPSTHQQSISEATSSYSIQPLTPHAESFDIPKVQLSIGYEVEQLGGNPPVTVEIDSCSPQCSPASVPHRDFELVSRTSTSRPSSSLSVPSGYRNSASIDSVSPTLAIIPSHDSTADVSSSLSKLVGPSSQKNIELARVDASNSSRCSGRSIKPTSALKSLHAALPGSSADHNISPASPFLSNSSTFSESDKGSPTDAPESESSSDTTVSRSDTSEANAHGPIVSTNWLEYRPPFVALHNNEKLYHAFGRIAVGAFSKVVVARGPSAIVAIKVIHKTPENCTKSKRRWLLWEQLFMETAALNKCTFLAHLHTSWEDHHNIYFSMKLYPETLRGRLARSRLLLHEVRLCFAELTAALRELSVLRIMHNDIKPENILIDVYGRCVISDFGLALGPTSETDDFSDFRMEQQVGTPGYMAPEVAAFSEDSVGYNYKADVYSLGLVLLEMALGLKDPYWDCTTAEEQIGLMSSKPLHWDDFRLSPVVEDFLGKMLETDPTRRWHPLQLIHHESFNLINWEKLWDAKYEHIYRPPDVEFCCLTMDDFNLPRVGTGPGEEHNSTDMCTDAFHCNGDFAIDLPLDTDNRARKVRLTRRA